MLGRRRAGLRSAGITLSGHRLRRWTVQGTAMADKRPAWARRMVEERAAPNWSHADAVRATMARLSEDQAVSEQDLLHHRHPTADQRHTSGPGWQTGL